MKSLGNLWFSNDFDMRAQRSAHDDFVVFCNGLLHFAVLRYKNVTAWYYLTRMAGGAIPAPLAWCKFTFRMDEGPESYANCNAKPTTDNPGGVGVVESNYF